MTAPLLLSRNEIDDVLWNELVKNSQQQIIYAYSWYLDVVCDHWQAFVWPSVEDYQVIMPLPFKRKWLIEVIEQPLFCQYLGIFSLHDLSATVTEKFLKSLANKFSYISSYHFNPLNTAILRLALPNFSAFRIRENTTFWLSLSVSYEDIFAEYSPDRKLNLKRSFAEKWSIKKSEDINPLIELFQRNHESKIQGGVRKSAYKLLSDLLIQINKHESATLFYALRNGSIHAGVLIIKSGDKAIYLFNAADEAGRRGNARTFLLDNFFQYNSGSPIFLDFESPEVRSIAKFYQGFGAKPMRFLEIGKNTLPSPLRQIQNWRIKKLVSTRQAPFEDF
ncbi:GNAT family N-acetyltransferase [Dyadobacter sp. CY345]|uniref:GNAT family N-acetyltransferase n=1 Tax=Dyadobacter sp. CY345 TaxID=2909335 RepID=UPI001F18F61F|nr:GNAT family N-acetyltransferase [Dyadobacter sp. CY345]MCF2447497.1 GNAT family N-acetyltransferase [Dyadobacter sp. CY345]